MNRGISMHLGLKFEQGFILSHSIVKKKRKEREEELEEKSPQSESSFNQALSVLHLRSAKLWLGRDVVQMREEQRKITMLILTAFQFRHISTD